MTRPAVALTTLDDLTRDSTVSELDERLASARETRRLYEHDWLLQIAFYLGHQWVGVDPSGRLFGEQASDDRVQLIDNRIRPAVRTNIAKQTKTDPTWVGVPRDGSDEEITRARLRQSLFEHYWRELEGRRRLRLALWYREVTGTGWWKLTWDQTAGESFDVLGLRGGPVLTNQGQPITPEQVDQLVPPEYHEQIEPRKITLGDARLEVKTPFELAVDPLATDEGLSTAEYIFEESIVSPARLAQQFDVDLERLEQDGRSWGGPVESRFPELTGYLDRQREARGGRGRRGVKVREYWSRPGVDHPKGRHVVWTAQGEILLEEPNPYPYLPYVLFNGPPSGRFHADAPIKDLISPQTERNKTKSQIADNAERTANPARAINAASYDADRQFLGLPGEEIVYTADTGIPGLDIPSYIQPPEMPVYVQRQLEDNENSIRVISGQFEVSQGGVPEGVTAASAISQLQEANDTQLGPEIGAMEDALTDAGKQLMWCLRHYASNDRIARVRGDSEEAWEFESWRGDRIGEANSDEVQVGSGMPESKAAKQAAIQFFLNLLIQNGQPLPPRELRRVFRDFDVGGLDHLFASVSRDVSQVAEENRRLMHGEQLPINSYDNDQLHLEEHGDFQKSSRYQRLAREPGGQMTMAIFEAHTGLHRQRLQDQANAAAAAQMAQAAAEKGLPGPDPNAVLAETPSSAVPSPSPSISAGG